MQSIGIRELRQNASKYIRMVKAGETIEVRERDVPVARLTPVPPPNKRKLTFEEMVAVGLATPAETELRDIEPLPATPGEKPLSQLLREMRDDERY